MICDTKKELGPQHGLRPGCDRFALRRRQDLARRRPRCSQDLQPDEIRKTRDHFSLGSNAKFNMHLNK